MTTRRLNNQEVVEYDGREYRVYHQTSDTKGYITGIGYRIELRQYPQSSQQGRQRNP